MKMATETIIVEAFDERALTILSARADEIIQSLTPPVQCGLFSTQGESLARFVFTPQGDKSESRSISEMWARSVKGLILKITDRCGLTVELALVVKQSVAGSKSKGDEKHHGETIDESRAR